MLTKHYFNQDGSFSGRASVGSLSVPENGFVIQNYIEEYPYPVKLKNGVIVQDTDYEPVDGKWVKLQSKKSVDRTLPKVVAWANLRDDPDLNGSWPQLKNALNKAVEELGEGATADEITQAAVEKLG